MSRQKCVLLMVSTDFVIARFEKIPLKLHSNCSHYSDRGIPQVEYLLARAFSVSVSEKTLFARKLKAAKTFPLQIRENVFSSSWKEHGWLPFSKGSCLYGFRKHFYLFNLVEQRSTFFFL